MKHLLHDMHRRVSQHVDILDKMKNVISMKVLSQEQMEIILLIISIRIVYLQVLQIILQEFMI